MWRLRSCLRDGRIGASCLRPKLVTSLLYENAIFLSESETFSFLEGPPLGHKAFFSTRGPILQTSISAASPPAATTWIDKYLPPRVAPYAHLARLDKPAGTWLLLWPGLWSIALAGPAGALPDLHLMALFGAGAFLLRSAGCTVNDLLDRHIDAKVERTKMRPIASGAVSPFNALLFLGANLTAGLGILLQLNPYSQVLGASSLALVFTYPLMKRITFWAYLGLTFNWGALLGWSAVHSSISLPVVAPLYLACVSWTLVYDTIYAHQDKVDDEQIGVKSTALLFADKTTQWLTLFGGGTVIGLGIAGYNGGLGCSLPFWYALCATSSHLTWQLASVDYNNRESCMRRLICLIVLLVVARA